MEGKIERIIPQSGPIDRCPECDRVFVNGHCVVHLDVEPEEDVRVKAGLDSGDTVIFGSETVEHLLGLTVDDLHALPEHDAQNIVQNKFKGKQVAVSASPIDEDDGVYRVQGIESFG